MKGHHLLGSPLDPNHSPKATNSIIRHNAEAHGSSKVLTACSRHPSNYTSPNLLLDPLRRVMPIHLIEQGNRVYYRCLCSGCGFEGQAYPTLEEAREGFFPASAEEAFEVSSETAIFFCARCHLRDHAPTAERLQEMIRDHLRRFSPDLSLEPGSLVSAVIEAVVFTRDMTNDSFLDRFTAILRADPGNRQRLTETLGRFMDRASASRLLRGIPTQLPKPLPDWCQEGALVEHRVDGALFRVGTINAHNVLLHGVDEHVQFSRYETFGDLFQLVEEASVWDLVEDEDWLSTD